MSEADKTDTNLLPPISGAEKRSDEAIAAMSQNASELAPVATETELLKNADGPPAVDVKPDTEADSTVVPPPEMKASLKQNTGNKERDERNRKKKELIVKDSFLDDFNCRRIKRVLQKTYAEGKLDKEQALAKAGVKEKNAAVAVDAKNLLWKILGEQWVSLAFGFPFMFAGSLIEFMAPNYIG